MSLVNMALDALLLALVTPCYSSAWIRDLQCIPSSWMWCVVGAGGRSWLAIGGASFFCLSHGHRQDCWMVQHFGERHSCGARTCRSFTNPASSQAPQSVRAFHHPASSWSSDRWRHHPDRHLLNGARRHHCAGNTAIGFQAIEQKPWKYC